ncbi:hypothetical protein GCM10020254_75530 [Streptomyces goshikiensis]
MRLAPAGSAGVSLTAFDERGEPVVSVESLLLRALDPARLHAARPTFHESLFRLEWPATAGNPASPSGRWAVVGTDTFGLEAALLDAGITADVYTDLDVLAGVVLAGKPVPDTVLVPYATDPAADTAGATREATHEALKLVQTWLAEETLAGARLVVVTRGAVEARPGEGVADLPGASVWGGCCGPRSRRTPAGSCCSTSKPGRTAPPMARRRASPRCSRPPWPAASPRSPYVTASRTPPGWHGSPPPAPRRTAPTSAHRRPCSTRTAPS